MGLNDTPSGERIHIGFFGRRNAGKSSVVNAVTGQQISIVSDTKGTTTDPVYKSMELLPLGPVMIIDTPGFDDEGNLGELRMKKTVEVLNKTDIAVLVVDSTNQLGQCETDLIRLFKEKNINYIIALNKSDLRDSAPSPKENEIYVSAKTGAGIFELKERMARMPVFGEHNVRLVGDFLSAGDLVVLVTPIDSAAPKGRMILPQQQVLRDVLDSDAAAVVVKENGLEKALSALSQKPALVITDSQAFKQVSEITPKDIPLTSFSILMARYKGFLETSVRSIKAIYSLKDGDTVLISEGCTHHRQCGDIGTVKIPKWLREKTGKELKFATSSGTEFPDDLSPYSLVVHCGGCMLNDREVKSRMKRSVKQGVPFTNYGITIAYTNGILKRSLEIFPDLYKLID